MNTASEKDTESTVTVREVEGFELYYRYTQQSEPQRVVVSLDAEHRELSASTTTEIGNGVPMRVYHGHVRRWTIPALNADAANALLAEIAPIAARVCDGYETRWNGNNHVAKYDEDAEKACEEIRDLCDEADPEDAIRVWDAGDWYAGLGNHDRQRKSLGITAATTNAELAALEKSEQEQAESDDVDLIENLDRHLEMLRDEAVREAKETWLEVMEEDREDEEGDE